MECLDAAAWLGSHPLSRVLGVSLLRRSPRSRGVCGEVGEVCVYRSKATRAVFGDERGLKLGLHNLSMSSATPGEAVVDPARYIRAAPRTSCHLSLLPGAVCPPCLTFPI